MTAKKWTESEIRTLARETVDGRQKTLQARGAYFRALIETAQADLGGTAGQDGQLAAVRAVHHKFYPVVWKAIASDDILVAAGFPKKDVGLERNRRLNFARSAYGTIKRWLKADGHDLMKLDANKVSKSQLERDAPPPKRHALTPRRINARAKKHLSDLVSFTREIAKVDQDQANAVAQDALDQLIKLIARLGTERKTTTDAHVAASEMRPLRVGGKVFWPMELRIAK
jgi:hypothetical protein